MPARLLGNFHPFGSKYHFFFQGMNPWQDIPWVMARLVAYPIVMNLFKVYLRLRWGILGITETEDQMSGLSKSISIIIPHSRRFEIHSSPTEILARSPGLTIFPEFRN
jgi:hypothetical protein